MKFTSTICQVEIKVLSINICRRKVSPLLNNVKEVCACKDRPLHVYYHFYLLLTASNLVAAIGKLTNQSPAAFDILELPSKKPKSEITYNPSLSVITFF